MKYIVHIIYGYVIKTNMCLSMKYENIYSIY